MSAGEEEFRAVELEVVCSRLPAGGRILEIGGGNGWQASLLTDRGLVVTSVDLKGRDRVATYHEVIDYDGLRLPFENDSFDAVFSSNVLEHVVDLDLLLAEIERVTTADAIGVHVVPTCTWRLWTSAVHPLNSVRSAIRRIRGHARAAVDCGTEGVGGTSPRHPLIRALFAGPHGEAPNALTELLQWREPNWRRRLERTGGFRVVDSQPMGLFYTGHTLLPWLGLATRRRLARMVGSSTRMYVTASVVR